MTEACREQHPLLHEDLSEEERFSPQRRFHRYPFRSRSRNKLNGAASIFKRWPGFWSTALIYWWIGIGMILITTLFIYNGITVFALLPPNHMGSPLVQTSNNNIEKPSAGRTSSLPDIYMHLLVNLGDEMDISKYLPYIEILTKQYDQYNYRLVMVVNDTMVDHVHSAEENNEEALNSLLHDSFNSYEKKERNRVSIEEISLTKYLDSSPLKKYWRNIPHHFIEFLVRAISIWDKGGIAFNPVILTPHSPNALYIEKIDNMLTRYLSNFHYEKDTNYLAKETNFKDYSKQRQKFNNIRDIIDAMDFIDDNQHDEIKKGNEDLASLETAESSLLSPMISDIFNSTKLVVDKLSESFHLYKDKDKIMNNTDITFSKESINNVNTQNHLDYDIYIQNKTLERNNTSSQRYFPVVLKYLFGGKEINKKAKIHNTENSPSSFNITRKRKSVINSSKIARNSKNENKERIFLDNEIVNNTYNNYKPMIVSANMTGNKILKVSNINKVDIDNDVSINKLTIDLKGNILGTQTSCHAFIGTLFSNVVHHDRNETVTDLIIYELSLFCKGLLSACSGIDVILL